MWHTGSWENNYHRTKTFLREGIETFSVSTISFCLSLEHCGLGKWESTTSSDKI